MKDQEIFDGFNISLLKKAKGSESYFSAEAIVLKSVKNPTKPNKLSSYLLAKYHKNLGNVWGMADIF